MGETAVLSVEGDIDMATAPVLDSGIARCFAYKTQGLVVDLSETDFLSSAGINVLVQRCAEAGTQNLGFALVASTVATLRLIEILGLRDVLKVFPTRADALRSIQTSATDGGSPDGDDCAIPIVQ